MQVLGPLWWEWFPLHWCLVDLWPWLTIPSNCCYLIIIAFKPSDIYSDLRPTLNKENYNQRYILQLSCSLWQEKLYYLTLLNFYTWLYGNIILMTIAFCKYKIFWLFDPELKLYLLLTKNGIFFYPSLFRRRRGMLLCTPLYVGQYFGKWVFPKIVQLITGELLSSWISNLVHWITSIWRWSLLLSWSVVQGQGHFWLCCQGSISVLQTSLVLTKKDLVNIQCNMYIFDRLLQVLQRFPEPAIPQRLQHRVELHVQPLYTVQRAERPPRQRRQTIRRHL